MALRDKLVETTHLAQAKARLQFRHPVVVAKFDLLVVPRAVRRMRHLRCFAGDAMAAKKLQASRELGVIGEGHAAFGSGDDLDRVETEYGDVAVPAVAHRLALVASADRVRSI